MKKLQFTNIRFPRISSIKLSSQLIITGFGLVVVAISILFGAFWGYSSALTTLKQLEKIALTSALGEQFILAEEDLASGRYNVAQQRFVYILENDPNFPGAAEKLVEALEGANISSQIITNLPTPTLTPTPDLRPIEELYSEAINLLNQHEWQKAIDTLTSLRKSDANFQTAKVDGYMYSALRFLGVEKIMSKGDLEGGIYDLALAEKFGPLDAEAISSQNLARMYMYGLSFWEVIPEQAVFYFGQVASAAPYLQDSSGWIAKNRYRSALIQYGDQLVIKKDWCKAVSQYSLALSIQEDNSLQKKFKDANDICSPPTETPVPSTVTATITETPIIIITPTWQPVSPTQAPTSTPTVQALITNTVPPTTTMIEIPTATQEPTSQPTLTETPKPTLNLTEAPSETPSS